MKLLPIASAISFAALMLTATAAVADPSGEWRVSDGTATVRIHRCGAGYCGTIASTSTPAGKDEKNPDPAKRNRSVLGIEVLFNMHKVAENVWAGKTYDAEDGQTYDAKISLQSEQALKIEGCAPGGGPCGSQVWSRVR